MWASAAAQCHHVDAGAIGDDAAYLVAATGLEPPQGRARPLRNCDSGANMMHARRPPQAAGSAPRLDCSLTAVQQALPRRRSQANAGSSSPPAASRRAAGVSIALGWDLNSSSRGCSTRWKPTLSCYFSSERMRFSTTRSAFRRALLGCRLEGADLLDHRLPQSLLGGQCTGPRREGVVAQDEGKRLSERRRNYPTGGAPGPAPAEARGPSLDTTTGSSSRGPN